LLEQLSLTLRSFSRRTLITLAEATRSQTSFLKSIFRDSTGNQKYHGDIARIWREGDVFLVEDLGSVNGTVVFGRDSNKVELAPRQPRRLESGDKLRLGETTLHFLVG